MKLSGVGRVALMTTTVSVLGMLPGCSWLTRPMEKPVIEDNMRVGLLHDSQIGILSLNPERRAVLYNFETKRLCAENPTEVGIDMSSASRLAADLKEAGSPVFGAQVALSAASNNYVLNRRSPGIILYQASTYQFCQMYANKAITEYEFKDLQITALRVAENILALETNALKEIRVEEEKRKSAEEARKAEEAKVDLQMEKNKKPEPAPATTTGAITTTTTTTPR